MVNLTGKKVVLIGGGKIAARKIKNLLLQNCKIQVVAPEIDEEISQIAVVSCIYSEYDKQFLEKADLIFACTNKKEVNTQIVRDAADTQWVNDCSEKKNSDFFNMNTIQLEEFVIAISTSGNSPKTAKRIKQELVEFLKIENDMEI